MHLLKRTLGMAAAVLLVPILAFSQQTPGSEAYPAICLAPIPFFDDFDDGFVVFRDGTRLDGKINIKDYEKSGERINLTTKDGKKHKLTTDALKYFGLNINIPRNQSPLNLYEWKNEKQKENKGAERGFVVLASGDTLDGKIHIEGRSSDSPRAEGNFFAIETLTFTDNTGKETEYKRDQIKSFGRILPWELSPNEMWDWGRGELFGKRKSKAQPGFAIMYDGSRIEGEMRLVIKNKMQRTKVDSDGMPSGFGGSDPAPKSKIYSDMVDEIWVIKEGKDEKLSMDDVYAFGVSGMTINTLTNKGNRLYQLEEMNFHVGSVTTRDGKKLEGYVALRPYDKNYYGIYYAAKPDDPIQIIPMKDITNITQIISMIEAFGEETAAPKRNTNINGYIVQAGGERVDGTVKLVGDNEWWAKSIEFTDKEGYSFKFGDADPGISYFVSNNSMYIQYEDLFVRTDRVAAPYATYPDPYPAKGSKFGQFAAGMAMQAGSMMIGEIAGQAMASAQRGGLDMSGVTIGGQDASGMGSSIPMYKEDGSVGGYIPRTNAQNIIGSSVSGMLLKEMQKEQIKNARKEGPQKSKNTTNCIFNIETGENVYASAGLQSFLEGCYDYYSLSKDEQKILQGSMKDAIDFLNKCMAKNKK
ncbi:MAG: hypothetical protein SH819_01770 [Cytophagales bacterium]|nr:hypothetical protein [Cytophagales bacterium]